MNLETGCLMIDSIDLEVLKEDFDKGITIRDTFEKLLLSSGIAIDDIYEIQALAPDLIPYEELILSILELF